MISSSACSIKQSRISNCNNSLLETTMNANVNFTFPEDILNGSMSKYQREARQQLQISKLIDSISTTIYEIIDKLLHQKIYSQITKIINQVLCIREEVNTFSKEGTQKQEEINQQFKFQIKKMKRKMQEMTSKSNSLNFNNFINKGSLMKKKESQVKPTEGIQSIIKDVYDFMQKNEATNLFRECEAKVQKIEQHFKQANINLAQKIEQLKKKQKPINENLRKQLNDALSKDCINKEVKRCLKENIHYLFDELVRSRKDIQLLKDQMKQISERQRQLQFSQTLLEHKLG